MVSSRAACVVLFVCAVAHSKAQLLCTPSATYRGKAASRTDITSTPSDDAYEFTLAGTPVKIYEQFGSFPSPVQEGIVRSGVPIPSLVAFDVCYENTAIGVDPTWTPQDIGVKERERPVGLKIQDGSKFDFYLSCEDSSCFDRVPDVTDILGFVPVTFDHAIISYEKGDDQGVVSSSSDVPDAIIKVSGEIHMEPSAKLCLGTFFANVVKFHLFRTGPSFYAETRSEDLSQATPPGPSQPFAIDDEDCNPTGQVANAEGTYQVSLVVPAPMPPPSAPQPLAPPPSLPPPTPPPSASPSPLLPPLPCSLPPSPAPSPPPPYQPLPSPPPSPLPSSLPPLCPPPICACAQDHDVPCVCYSDATPNRALLFGPTQLCTANFHCVEVSTSGKIAGTNEGCVEDPSHMPCPVSACAK